MITEKERLRFTELADEGGDRAKIECFCKEIGAIFDYWPEALEERRLGWWKVETFLISALGIAEGWRERIEVEPTQ